MSISIAHNFHVENLNTIHLFVVLYLKHNKVEEKFHSDWIFQTVHVTSDAFSQRIPYVILVSIRLWNKFFEPANKTCHDLLCVFQNVSFLHGVQETNIFDFVQLMFKRMVSNVFHLAISSLYEGHNEKNPLYGQLSSL